MPSSNGIEARHVGLTSGAGEDEPVEKNSGPWFKIAVVAIIVVILILGGYLVYSKFMQPVPETDLPNNFLDSQPSDQTNTPVEVEPISEESDSGLAATSSEEIIPLIPGLQHLPDLVLQLRIQLPIQLSPLLILSMPPTPLVAAFLPTLHW